MFETKANRSNLEFEEETQRKSSGSFSRNKLPVHYLTLENILPDEPQLLVGRYQTMLYNQSTQTLKQLREEQELCVQMVDVMPKAAWLICLIGRSFCLMTGPLCRGLRTR